MSSKKLSFLSFCINILTDPIRFLSVYFKEIKNNILLKQNIKKIYFLSIPIVLVIMVMPTAFIGVSTYMKLGGGWRYASLFAIGVIIALLLLGFAELFLFSSFLNWLLLKSSRLAGDTTPKEKISDLSTYLVAYMILLFTPFILGFSIFVSTSTLINKELILEKNWPEIFRWSIKPLLIIGFLEVLFIIKWVNMCYHAILQTAEVNNKKFASKYSLFLTLFLIVSVIAGLSFLALLVNKYIPTF